MSRPSTPATRIPKSPTKLASRSPERFNIGPPFQSTESVAPLHDKHGFVLPLALSARIDRGMTMVGSEWTGHRRNFISACASFSFCEDKHNIATPHGLHIKHSGGCKIEIVSFAIQLRAQCCITGQFITLVQSGPKRHDPKVFSPRIPVSPGDLPSHMEVKKLKAVSLNSQSPPHTILGGNSHNTFLEIGRRLGLEKDSEFLLVARFERILVPSGKTWKRSSNVRHYKIVAELVGVADGHEAIVLARTSTQRIRMKLRSGPHDGKVETKLHDARIAKFDEKTSVSTHDHKPVKIPLNETCPCIKLEEKSPGWECTARTGTLVENTFPVYRDFSSSEGVVMPPSQNSEIDTTLSSPILLPTMFDQAMLGLDSIFQNQDLEGNVPVFVEPQSFQPQNADDGASFCPYDFIMWPR